MKPFGGVPMGDYEVIVLGLWCPGSPYYTQVMNYEDYRFGSKYTSPVPETKD
jgi:hypothetical protein